MLRFLTAGESHGKAEIAILEGMPAGLEITEDDIQKDLNRRKKGAGRGGRGKIETDEAIILSGIRHNKTLGSPIAIIINNKDFTNWGKKITTPRPGHADLAGASKYGFDDIRNVIERASARETVGRVAVGAICRKFLSEFNIKIVSHTVQIGNITIPARLSSSYILSNTNKIDPETRCIVKKTSYKMKQIIRKSITKKDTLGGVIEIIAHNVVPGLGSHVHWDRKLDGRLAHILMSIPSVKAVEIGDGNAVSSKFGSEVHDEIFYKGRKFIRKTNRAGGIEGGISNGEDIIIRVFHKPIPTLGKPLQTIDINNRQSTKALIERSDICVVPRAGVISESAVAFVLADCILEKFGGDSIIEVKRNFNYYIKSLS